MAQQPVYPTMDQKFDAPPPYFPEQVGMQQAPPPGFVQPAMTSTTTVITTEPLLVPSHVVVTGYALPQSHKPLHIQCPHCQAEISTATTHETGMLTHLIAIVLCVVVCWPCVCIPYCVDGCKDTSHSCPACKRHLGVIKRL